MVSIVSPYVVVRPDKLLGRLAVQPANFSYSDLLRLCTHYFGEPRQSGSSHAVFKTPWPGDPRVNIQNDKGQAKPYQVRQVLAAIAKLGEMS